jgi:hypothetical protein
LLFSSSLDILKLWWFLLIFCFIEQSTHSSPFQVLKFYHLVFWNILSLRIVYFVWMLVLHEKSISMHFINISLLVSYFEEFWLIKEDSNYQENRFWRSFNYYFWCFLNFMSHFHISVFNLKVLSKISFKLELIKWCKKYERDSV